MKQRIADGSVGFPHVRVGHRQAPYPEPQVSNGLGFSIFWGVVSSDQLWRGPQAPTVVNPVGIRMPPHRVQWEVTGLGEA